MTGDDLKRMQDHFLEGGKAILRESGRLYPIGFVVTLHKHVDKLLESGGWGLEIIDPRTCVLDNQDDDKVATLVVDLLMDWKRLYHAVLNVYPQTRGVLPPMIKLAKDIGADDPYKRTTRAFLSATQLDTKDVIAATMRKICGEVEAFASIMQCEAWQRCIDLTDKAAIEKANREGLTQDAKAVEVLFNSMETYDFTRLITIPIHREAAPPASKKRDEGRVVGFGEPSEGLDTTDNTNVAEGRFVRFLKPLETAS